jgi:hypothetical protein
METHGSINVWQSIELCGSVRLAARVNDLRNDGHDIRTEIVRTETGKKVARYSLVMKPAFQLTN